MNRFPALVSKVGRWVRDGWLIAGIALLVLIGLEVAYRVQASVRRIAAGAPATPPSHPYSDSVWYREYREEYDRSTQLEWRPYVYYRRPPFVGRHINIDSAQHRLTAHPARVPADAPDVFFFGGSTMWGDYQRDSFTIPSVVVSHLAEDGISIRATNFGESGYVMTQGVLELLMQLRDGARPDVVVFYDGINDVAAAVQSGLPGIPQNEFNRAAEFRLGRAVRGWEEGQGVATDLRALGLLTLTGAERSQLLQRLLQVVRSPTAGVDADMDDLASEILATYAGNVEAVDALAGRYGFQPIFVWQPNPHASTKTLTEFERGVDGTLDADPFQQRLGAVHRFLDERLPEVMDARIGGRFLHLTAAFEGDTGPVWVDQIGHTTEEAAGIVGRAIGDRVKEVLQAQ